MKEKKKLLLTVLGVIIFIITITGITYAAFVWASDPDTGFISGKGDCFVLDYTKGVYDSYFLTPASFNASAGWYVSNLGYVRWSDNVYQIYPISSTFFLDASLGLLSGDGSKGNPYVVG